MADANVEHRLKEGEEKMKSPITGAARGIGELGKTVRVAAVAAETASPQLATISKYEVAIKWVFDFVHSETCKSVKICSNSNARLGWKEHPIQHDTEANRAEGLRQALVELASQIEESNK